MYLKAKHLDMGTLEFDEDVIILGFVQGFRAGQVLAVCAKEDNTLESYSLEDIKADYEELLKKCED